MALNAIAKAPIPLKKLIIFCDGTWCGPEHGTRTKIQLLAEMTGIDMNATKSSRELADTSRRLRAKYFNGISCNYLTYGFGASPDNLERLIPHGAILQTPKSATSAPRLYFKTPLVKDLLAQKATELAFDFEWLTELTELGYGVEDIAAVLVEEENESPWLLVSGGNFTKRALKMSKKLECNKRADNTP